METKIRKLLEKNNLTADEIVSRFPKKHWAKARQSLTALILENKLGLMDNKYFLLSKESNLTNAGRACKHRPLSLRLVFYYLPR